MLHEQEQDDVLWTWFYLDDGGPTIKSWSAHMIRKRTERFVYVDPSPWNEDTRTLRLNRAELDREGLASSRSDGHQTFYTTAEKERIEAADHKAMLEAWHQGALLDLKTGRLRMELGSRLDFHEVAPGIVKMADAPVYAHDGRREPCIHCDGKGKHGRSKCWKCFGKGTRSAMDNFDDHHKLERIGSCYCSTTARDLDDLRDDFVRHVSLGTRQMLTFVLVAHLGPAVATA